MKRTLKAAFAAILALVMALATLPSLAVESAEAEPTMPKKTTLPDSDLTDRHSAGSGERAIWDGSIATSFDGGTGTKDDPYRIANGAQLAYLAQQVNSGADSFENKHLKLTADIYLNDTANWESWGSVVTPANEWTPIGFGTYNGAYYPYFMFEGSFDGSGHAVHGMYINATACPEYVDNWNSHKAPHYGLFGNTSFGIDCAEILNLNIESSYIKVVGRAVIGLLAGKGSCVTNCISNGKIVAEAYYDASEEYFNFKSATVGGLIGSGSAWKCDNHADIFASNPSAIGGIVGEGSADRCTNYGNIDVVPLSYSVTNYYEETYEVEGLNGEIGGVAGRISYTRQCINKGNINVRLANWDNSYVYIGGIAGRTAGYSYVYVSDSYNAGSINVTIPDMLEITDMGAESHIEIGGIGGIEIASSFCYNSGRININGDVSSFIDYGRDISKYAINYLSFAETCYYLDADCYTGDESGIALTDAQMRDENSFADFDFHNIWTIEPATAYPYPQLIHELDKSMGGSSAIWTGNASSGFASGSGTQSDPYIINTAEQLAYLAKSVNEGNSYEGKFVKLNRDISLNNYNAKYWTLNATPWTPIGDEVLLDDGTYTVFKGSFNGSGHTIFGAYIAHDGSSKSMQCYNWGLFGRCSNATISNLNIRNSFVDAPTYSVGSGGIVGEINDGSIVNCSSSADVYTACWQAGGVVGRAFASTIESCYSTGSVHGCHSGTGGIVGWADDGTNIVNCYNTGNVIGMQSVGGIVGVFSAESGDGHAKVSQCYNTGRVVGRQYYDCGEIIGEAMRYDAENGWYEQYDGNHFIQNGYYLDTCCIDGNGYGTALTDAQLRSQSSYAGFDFSTVWTMQGNNDYPYAELKNNPHGEVAIPGDLDGNGSVTTADAIIALRLAMQLVDGSGLNMDAADMDGNGSVTLADAILIMRTAMGLA